MNTNRFTYSFPVTVFICCFLFLYSCDQIKKKIIPDAGSQYNAAEEMRRAKGDTTIPQRPVPKNESTINYGNYSVKWEVTTKAILWTAYDGKTKKAEGTINLSDNLDKYITSGGNVNVDELIKEVQKLIPNAGSQYNAAEELRWSQGKSDKLRPYAPQGINTPNKVPKGCYYSFSWNSPNATQCCVNWSFYNKKGEKKEEDTSNWIDKLEHTWRVPNEEGVMYVNVYAKNSGGQSQEPLAFEVKVVAIDENQIEKLSYEDYLSVFSNPSTYNKKFAYWCAKAANAAYSKSKSNAAMDTMGFSNTSITPSALQAFVGYKELDKPINNTTSVIMIAIRGTNVKDVRNFVSDLDAAPVNWKTGKETLNGGRIGSEIGKAEGGTLGGAIGGALGVVVDEYAVEIFDKTPEAHGGFYKCTELIWSEMQKNKYYKANNLKNTLFVVTGHSLGGAIAELLSLKLKENDVPTKNIICYGFASPPVGDKDLYDFANGKYGGKPGELSNQIHKIMNTRDPIPTAGIFAYTLAYNPYKFTYDASNFWQEHWILSKEQAGHKMDLVYLNHILSTLEKVYCVKAKR